jgi:hypothetical protein
VYEQYRYGHIPDVFRLNGWVGYRAFIINGADVHDITETLGRFLFGYYLLLIGLFDSVSEKKRQFGKLLHLLLPCSIAYLLLGSGDTLFNTAGGLWTNLFLASISPSGQVVWKRNLTRENPDAFEVGCLARHPDGSVWYAHNNFSVSVICRLDANGNEQRMDSVSGIRILSGIAFDPFGNRYLCGANESGTVTINDLSINATTTYGQFVARVRAEGTAHWAYSTGFFTRGRQMPAGADPFAYLQPLAQHYLQRLTDGTIVLLGNQRATVD